MSQKGLYDNGDPKKPIRYGTLQLKGKLPIGYKDKSWVIGSIIHNDNVFEYGIMALPYIPGC